jgi:cytidylate kinase
VKAEPRAEPREGPVVTVDGPAGSGKSTTAREVARRLGFRHLDSGSFYRALTFGLLEAGVEAEHWEGLRAPDLDRIGVVVEPTATGFSIRLGDRALGEELRSSRVTERVSRLAGLAAVRAWLLGIQRLAGRRGRLVADGRDMGTVVFPDAEVKVFLVADLAERARRRLRDHGVADPSPAEVEREAERIAARDRSDSDRELSPLRRPEGALVLDTTRLTFEQQVDVILARVALARVSHVDRPGGPV